MKARAEPRGSAGSGPCRTQRLAKLFRYRSFGQVVDVRGDGLELGRIKDPTPAFHARVRCALTDDGHHLVGLVAMFPLIVREVADRRSEQVAGDRAVTATLVAVTCGATTQEDGSALAQERILGDLGRRWGWRLAQESERHETARHQSQHHQEDKPRGRGIDGGDR